MTTTEQFLQDQSKPPIAKLNVQLIGHTVFTPPTTEAEDGNLDIVFWPDEKNELDVPLGARRQYDGQALAEFAGRACYQSFNKPNPRTASNKGYLGHILEVGHGSVLEHASITFYLTGFSRSCTHEIIRHRHFSFSELSQRYVDVAQAKYVLPPLFRQMYDDGREIPWYTTATINGIGKGAYRTLVEAAESYIAECHTDVSKTAARKLAREASRAVMASMTETRMVLTGNYRAWVYFLNARDSEHADAEIRELAQEIGSQLAGVAPNIFGEEARELWPSNGL